MWRLMGLLMRDVCRELAILSFLREHWQLGSLRSADKVAGPTHPLLWGRVDVKLTPVIVCEQPVVSKITKTASHHI